MPGLRVEIFNPSGKWLELVPNGCYKYCWRFYVPGSPRVEGFVGWLKQIRAHGEQFSGPQLAKLRVANILLGK